MEKKIRVNFADQPYVDLHDDLIYKCLNEMYDVVLSDDPDYLICSVYGHDHIDYNCIKIEFIGENVAPDFNCYDYAIGFDRMIYGDRYLRVPLYNFYGEYRTIVSQDKNREMLVKEIDKNALINRKFCSYIVSNGEGDPLRTQFFQKLSKYRKVDSGGRYMNNIGGPVASKTDFCSRYKFNIAFENSSVEGYTTEKIVEPLAVRSVPIYWGDPSIEKDFYSKCMVRVRSKDDVDRVIDEIISLDKDDDAYLERCLSPRLIYPDEDYYNIQLKEFLRNIIEQPLVDARRVSFYGWQANVRRGERQRCKLYDSLELPIRAAKWMRKRAKGWLQRR